MNVLIDTSYLVALNVKTDKNHANAVKFASTFRDNALTPELMFVELFFMVKGLASYEDAIRAVSAAYRSSIKRLLLEPTDIERASQIMKKYQSLTLDLVDASIMVLSEKLQITQVVTFDRRDFTAFKPMHCDYLTLLP